MQSESAAVVAYALPLLGELIRVHLRQCMDGIPEGVRSWDHLPGTFALDNAFDQPFLAGRGEQAPVQITKLTLTVIVSARQARYIVTVKQPRGVIERGLWIL